MSIATKNLDILIVEDNFRDYKLVKEYLEERFEQINCNHAFNYIDAEKFLEKEKNLDVIFLDITLPDISGKPLIKKVINNAGLTPVIILTGSLNLNFCTESLELGVSDYLFKDELSPNSLFKSINYTIEKQKQHHKILESEKKYSDLFHLSPVAIYVYDIKTLKFLDVNSAAIQLFEYTKEEFLSMHLNDILFSKDAKTFIDALEEANKKESYSFENYFLYKKKSGKEIKAEITVKTIKFQNRNARLIVANDITERLHHFEALAFQNKRLKEIAWQQSHELRSPATKILGIIELLKSNLCSGEEHQLLIDEIEKSIKELDQVIRSISEKSKQINPGK